LILTQLIKVTYDVSCFCYGNVNDGYNAMFDKKKQIEFHDNIKMKTTYLR